MVWVKCGDGDVGCDEGTKTRTTTRTSNGSREIWMMMVDMRYECLWWMWWW